MRSCTVGVALVALAVLTCAHGKAAPNRVLRKRSCVIGLNSHHCSLSEMDASLRLRDRLMHGFGPGKRAGYFPLEERFVGVRKRTCQLRLGGLCLTEAMDRAASQLQYLKSAHSPGRRRRNSPADGKPAQEGHLSALTRDATRATRR